MLKLDWSEEWEVDISEKKNTGFIVLVTLLVVLVIGLTGYIAYDKIGILTINEAGKALTTNSIPFSL